MKTLKYELAEICYQKVLSNTNLKNSDWKKKHHCEINTFLAIGSESKNII